MPNPVIASPSLELNVTLTVWLAPTATDTSDGVRCGDDRVVRAGACCPRHPRRRSGPWSCRRRRCPSYRRRLPETLPAPYAEPPLLLPHGEVKSQPDSSSSARAEED